MNFMVGLDKIIYMIDNVSASEFQKFKDGLDVLDMAGKIVEVDQRIGKGHSEYHYQLNIGRGDGAIFIGWQHNMSKALKIRGEDTWSLKVEYNPNKTSEGHEDAIRWLQKRFGERSKRITLIDFCYDVAVRTDDIFVIPKQGREENRFRGDRYYGHKSNHGYLKVYDKKRERKERGGEELDLDHLTRIEYTWKIKDGIELDMFWMISPDDTLVLGNEYIIRRISGLDLHKIEPETRACLIAIMYGQMQVKEFSRRKRPHIEKALEQCEELALGPHIRGSWDSIVKVIKRHIMDYDSSEL